MNRIHDGCLKIVAQIENNEWLTMRVCGDCMRPVLSSGEVIRVTKKRWYLPGDILVFHGAAQTFTSHRFLGYMPTHRGLRLTTKADNNHRFDGWIRRENVIGKITHVSSSAEPLRIPLQERCRAIYHWVAVHFSKPLCILPDDD